MATNPDIYFFFQSVILPRDKLQHLHAKTIQDHLWFKSLIGHLVFASKVCPLGKAFMNALFALKAGLKPGQPSRLDGDARADLACWHILQANWQGTLVHQFLLLRHPDQASWPGILTTICTPMPQAHGVVVLGTTPAGCSCRGPVSPLQWAPSPLRSSYPSYWQWPYGVQSGEAASSLPHISKLVCTEWRFPQSRFSWTICCG